MKTVSRIVVLFLLAAPAAVAAERVVALKDAPGRETVQSLCAGCHSLDYIPLNSPFMNRQTWMGEVTKMMNAYGAPIPETDAAKIVDYLSVNYGQP